MPFFNKGFITLHSLPIDPSLARNGLFIYTLLDLHIYIMDCSYNITHRENVEFSLGQNRIKNEATVKEFFLFQL